MLSMEAQGELLQIARTAIAEHLHGRQFTPVPQNLELREPGAAFVSVWKGGELRGCIGSLKATRPLAETVSAAAVSAATADPRFPPLRIDEMPHVSLEISLLSPLVRIHSPKEIEVGTHGLVVTSLSRKGVLLPQVALEWGWDRGEFLRQTFLKAHLPHDPSQSVSEIYTFTAEVIREGEHRPLP